MFGWGNVVNRRYARALTRHALPRVHGITVMLRFLFSISSGLPCFLFFVLFVPVLVWLGSPVERERMHP